MALAFMNEFVCSFPSIKALFEFIVRTVYIIGVVIHQDIKPENVFVVFRYADGFMVIDVFLLDCQIRPICIFTDVISMMFSRSHCDWDRRTSNSFTSKTGRCKNRQTERRKRYSI